MASADEYVPGRTREIVHRYSAGQYDKRQVAFHILAAVKQSDDFPRKDEDQQE